MEEEEEEREEGENSMIHCYYHHLYTDRFLLSFVIVVTVFLLGVFALSELVGEPLVKEEKFLVGVLKKKKKMMMMMMMMMNVK